MKPKIGLITLGVRDIAASRAFYEGLGFPVRFAEDGFVMFELEGANLSLFPIEKLAEDAGGLPVGIPGAAITLAHNEPSKADVDRVYQDALALGAKPVKKPEDAFWGGYSGYFADPDGHLWEIAWNPMDPDLA